MDVAEYNDLINSMLQVANNIAFHQQMLANIESRLQEKEIRPLEEDFIYRAHSGRFPFEPFTREVAGVQIQVRVLHRQGVGMSDLVAGDILYEIAGEKYAVAQFKNVGSDLRAVKVDGTQLAKLRQNCPELCYNRRKTYLQELRLVNGFCGNYYRVQFGTDARYLPVCEVVTMLNGGESLPTARFASGLDEKTFEVLFANCRIGARVRTKSPETQARELLDLDHFVLWITQYGRWSS